MTPIYIIDIVLFRSRKKYPKQGWDRKLETNEEQDTWSKSQRYSHLPLSFLSYTSYNPFFFFFPGRVSHFMYANVSD